MATEAIQTNRADIRTAFEDKVKFMRLELSLEWDSAGFYSNLDTDRAFTWFEIGFEQAHVQAQPKS